MVFGSSGGWLAFSRSFLTFVYAVVWLLCTWSCACLQTLFCLLTLPQTYWQIFCYIHCVSWCCDFGFWRTLSVAVEASTKWLSGNSWKMQYEAPLPPRIGSVRSGSQRRVCFAYSGGVHHKLRSAKPHTINHVQPLFLTNESYQLCFLNYK